MIARLARGLCNFWESHFGFDGHYVFAAMSAQPGSHVRLVNNFIYVINKTWWKVDLAVPNEISWPFCLAAARRCALLPAAGAAPVLVCAEEGVIDGAQRLAAAVMRGDRFATAFVDDPSFSL